jgi:8-oxo-dGTP pyrophosphatase MutT (NUDIX family)
MYCNNCGEKGHVFRGCKDPVLSCGLVVLDSSRIPADVGTVKVLMIRRKDSMSFAEFMRGKYDPTDTDYVGRLLSNMTVTEQRDIVNKSFDDLWRQLWGDDHTSNEYLTSKEKFGSLDRAGMVSTFASVYPEPEWGFPKGRRVRTETDLECALREFNEETNVPREAYVVLNNILLEETFTGLNGVQYRHVYFVALLTKPELVNLGQKMTYMQKREISGIGWKTLEECRNYVRPHHVERLHMIESLTEIVRTYESH